MTFTQSVSLIADITEIALGISAIVVAWTQRDKISSAFSILLNYSFQASLSELKHWIEILQENSEEDGDSSRKFRQAIAFIFGKIKGNPVLYAHFTEKMLRRLKLMMDDLDSNKTVTTTHKIRLYSEIRESLYTLEVEKYK